MKLGLVLEGGASRTLFSCGVMDALLDENIKADYIIGVSAGIAYGTSYASGQIGRNLKVSAEYMADKRYMGLRHMFNPKNRSYYNLDFVFGEIPQKLVPFDYDAFEKFKGEIIAVVTNLETGLPEYMEVPRDISSLKLLEASCALPILFKPQEIDGKLYMDGGIGDSIPFKRALDDGCDKIITVLTREKDYLKNKETSTAIAKKCYRKYPEFLRALDERPEKYNQSRKELFEYAEKNNSIVIMPNDTKNFHHTEKNPARLTDIYNEGYKTTMDMMDSIKKYINS